MQYCAKYKLKGQFKKICDLLRSHLDEAMTINDGSSNIPNPVKITDDDCFTSLLKLRLTVIKYSIKLESWVEGFKVADSILEMDQAKAKMYDEVDTELGQRRSKLKGMKNSDRASLYDHMSKIFWKSQYYIMHAATLVSMDKKYQRKRDRTFEHKRETANQAILATMISSVKNTLSNYRSVIWSDASGYGRKFDKRAAFKKPAHKYEHPENLSRITLVEYIRKS